MQEGDLSLAACYFLDFDEMRGEDVDDEDEYEDECFYRELLCHHSFIMLAKSINTTNKRIINAMLKYIAIMHHYT